MNLGTAVRSPGGAIYLSLLRNVHNVSAAFLCAQSAIQPCHIYIRSKSDDSMHVMFTFLLVQTVPLTTCLCHVKAELESSVGTVTGYRLHVQRNFRTIRPSVQLAPHTLPSPGVKRQTREGDHPPHSSTTVPPGVPRLLVSRIQRLDMN
jgi:hypothetical protein